MLASIRYTFRSSSITKSNLTAPQPVALAIRAEGGEPDLHLGGGHVDLQRAVQELHRQLCRHHGLFLKGHRRNTIDGVL